MGLWSYSEWPVLPQLRTMGDSSFSASAASAYHTPQSMKQELARLTKDLELTPEQQQHVRLLLEEHHARIQALLDKHPTASRQQLGPQIHAVSDETHRKIHALLNDHQRELEQAMQQGEYNGGENRRSAPPAAASSEPPSSALDRSGSRPNRKA